MASKFYGGTGTQGGATGDLDSINGGSLADADGAFVIDLSTNQAGIYVLDIDNAGTERADVVIAPDASGGDKRWLLRALLSTGLKVYEPATVSVTDIAMSSGNLLIDNQFDTGTITFQGENSGNKTLLAMDPAGSVELYEAGTKTFETTAAGVEIGDGTAAGITIGYTADDAYITNTDADGEVYIQAERTATGTSTLLHGDPDGAATLYFNNSAKFATSNTGGTLTGTLVADGVTLGDNEYLSLGAGTDGKIYSDGTNLILGVGAEIAIAAVLNGATSLYYDNTVTLTTSATGVTIGDGTADGFAIGYSADDIILTNLDPDGKVKIYSRNAADDATNLMLTLDPDTASILYYAATACVSTAAGWLSFWDSSGATEGRIYKAPTFLTFKNMEESQLIYMQATDAGSTVRNMVSGDPDAGVTLYHISATKAETVSDGLAVTGALRLTEITTPTATANNGKIYTKSDNKLYFQDGAGTEYTITMT